MKEEQIDDVLQTIETLQLTSKATLDLMKKYNKALANIWIYAILISIATFIVASACSYGVMKWASADLNSKIQQNNEISEELQKKRIEYDFLTKHRALSLTYTEDDSNYYITIPAKMKAETLITSKKDTVVILQKK